MLKELMATDGHQGDKCHELLEVALGVAVRVQALHQAVQRGLVFDVLQGGGRKGEGRLHCGRSGESNVKPNLPPLTHRHQLRQLVVKQLPQLALLQLVLVSFSLRVLLKHSDDGRHRRLQVSHLLTRFSDQTQFSKERWHDWSTQSWTNTSKWVDSLNTTPTRQSIKHLTDRFTVEQLQADYPESSSQGWALGFKAQLHRGGDASCRSKLQANQISSPSPHSTAHPDSAGFQLCTSWLPITSKLPVKFKYLD